MDKVDNKKYDKLTISKDNIGSFLIKNFDTDIGREIKEFVNERTGINGLKTIWTSFNSIYWIIILRW